MPDYSDRVFQGKSTFPGLDEWFYRAREGVAGPYFSREDAAVALSLFVKYCKDNGLTGGRDVGGPSGCQGSALQAMAWSTLHGLPGRVAAAWAGCWPERRASGKFRKEF
jgi:hypothetical protein